jgi:chemotaxis protein MotB
VRSSPSTFAFSSRLGPAVLLIGSLALLSACVTQQRYDDLLAERDVLVLSNERLTSQRGELADVAAALGTELLLRDREVSILEQTERDLRAELATEIIAGEIEIALQRDGLHVVLPHSVLFAEGSADIAADGRGMVLKLVDDFQRVGAQIVVLGYTDDVSIGSRLAQRYPTNWELAGARAASVVRVFQEGGVDPGRLLAASAGESNPVASNDSPEGRARNRRIDIRLRPTRR